MTETPYGKVAAIGSFDGVHRGHQAVLNTVAQLALKNNKEAIAITFDRHPLSVIAPARAPRLISTPRRRNYLIGKTGVSPQELTFDDRLRKMTASEWMAHMKNEMMVDILVMGYDNTFGSDGVTMSIADYKKEGERLGIRVEEAPIVEGVSSSAIRKAITDGEIERAAQMLGRDFHLPGIVRHGNKIGRTMGFPTANLKVSEELVIPKKGVYAAMAKLPDGSEHAAMVNIGTRPTLKRGDNLMIEAHILDWEGDLYDKNIRIYFKKRLRDEEEYKTIDQLRLQLKKDKEETLKSLTP